MITKNKIIKIIDLAKKCNECALDHFKKFDDKLVSYKYDNSPLTNADIKVHDIAVAGLKNLFPSLKIISEELYNSKDFFKNKKYFWLIDPIDGTKEFINKSPNFTVNFALIKNNSPIFGLIAQPTTGTIWFNFNNKAWRLNKGQDFKHCQRIQCTEINYQKIRTLSSFNHRSKELEDWMSFVKPISDQDIGSSIKFCYLAEGKVDFYPRTSPTMEWDIAAGHSILKSAGGNVISVSGIEIKYGKMKFLNDIFLAHGKTQNIPNKFLIKLKNKNFDKYKEDLKESISELKKENLVVFPTETVYGLGAIGSSKKAIKSIYSAKKRPSNNPLIVHTFDKKEAEKFGKFTSTANILTERYWPGPLTVILQTKQNDLAKILSQGKSTIAIRVPSHPVARDLLEQIKIPILAPSANKSGGVSPTEINHVKDDFGPDFKGKDWKLSKIIDYGSCEVGIESTVVDCRGDLPIILRHGYITSEMISNIFNSPILIPQDCDELISPGQMKSHYSPKANVYINQKSNISDSAWLTFGNLPKTLQKEKIMFNLSPSGNLFQACNLLYSGLRHLDSFGVKIIQVMPIPMKGIGIAINDRLKRASFKN